MNIQTTTLRGTLGVLALGGALLQGIETFASGELAEIEYKAVCRATLPANVVWNTPDGTGDFALVRQTETSHNVREPDADVASYSGAYDPDQCTFNCIEGYVWNGSSCNILGAECETENITIGAYTIAKCNVGAGEAGTGSASYGYYFQRGNNYGFPNIGEVTTNGNKVDTNSNGPGNYYSSGTFITVKYDWSEPKNDNLRGGNGDNGATRGPGTDTDRQGPCPDGYHVPSAGEWGGVLATWWSIRSGDYGGATYSDNGGLPSVNATNVNKGFMDDFLLPLAGSRNYQLPAGVFNQGVNAGYWSSSPDNTNVHYLGFDSSSVRDYGGYRTGGLPVRCFQNASA